MLSQSLKSNSSQVVANCVFFMFWVPNLIPGGLLCRNAKHLLKAYLKLLTITLKIKKSLSSLELSLDQKVCTYSTFVTDNLSTHLHKP